MWRKSARLEKNNTLRKDVFFRMHRVRHRHIFRHDRAALQELKSGIGRQCGTQASCAAASEKNR